MQHSDQEQMKAILKEAISAEEAAYQLYERAIDMVADEQARTVLRELRDEELLHKEMLETIDIDSWSILPEEPERDELTFSDYLVGGKLSEGADLQEIILFAIKKEKGARDFYSQLAETTSSRKAKEFFLKLSQMEEKHKQKCEALYWETYGG